MNASPSKTRLLLIRHGEVEERYHRVFGGRIDMDLSALGRSQAKELASHLKATHFDALYVSPMARAQQTIAPIAHQNRPSPRVLDGLREIDFGAWTGLAWNQVLDRHGKSAFDWLRHIDLDEIPDAENGATFRARIEPCLNQILNAHPGQQVGIVCHGGVIRMILSILLDLPLPKMAAFEIDYASLTIVDVTPERREIKLLNFTPWSSYA